MRRRLIESSSKPANNIIYVAMKLKVTRQILENNRNLVTKKKALNFSFCYDRIIEGRF